MIIDFVVAYDVNLLSDLHVRTFSVLVLLQYVLPPFGIPFLSTFAIPFLYVFAVFIANLELSFEL